MENFIPVQITQGISEPSGPKIEFVTNYLEALSEIAKYRLRFLAQLASVEVNKKPYKIVISAPIVRSNITVNNRAKIKFNKKNLHLVRNVKCRFIRLSIRCYIYTKSRIYMRSLLDYYRYLQINIKVLKARSILRFSCYVINGRTPR